MTDYTYKLGFAFAVTLHVVLVFLLLIKFTNSRPFALNPGKVINAVVVSERNLSNQASKIQQNILPKPKEEITNSVPPEQITKPQPQPVVPNIKPQIKDHIKDTLQKNLLLEQAKEMAALKKERQIYKKQQMQKALQEQAQAEQKELANEQASVASAQAQGEVDKYKAMVVQAISSQWIVPNEVDKSAICQLLINVAPGGVVLNVQLLSSSGSIALDRAAQAAVLKASPLPVPQDLGEFRELRLTFNPLGVVVGN